MADRCEERTRGWMPDARTPDRNLLLPARSMRLLALTIAAILLPDMGRAATDAGLIRERVETFYRWYVRHADDPQQPEFLRPGMDRFITPALKATLSRQYRSDSLPDDGDPFLHVQDWAPDTMVAASAPTGLPGDPRVEVRLGDTHPLTVCVHLRRSAQNWKIDRVDPSGMADAPADCRTRTVT